MGILWDRLQDEIIVQFHIGDKKNVHVCQRIKSGHSGAEIYLIELMGTAKVKGFFFLKIDCESEEYNNILRTFCFSNVVKCVDQKIIRNYYVLLLQAIGKKNVEYRDFYSLHSPEHKRAVTALLCKRILEEAADVRTLPGEFAEPVRVFQRQLGDKLASDGILAEFLSAHMQGIDVENVPVVQIENRKLRNVYAYAVNNALWKEKKLRDIRSCIHGDLHGGNVLVSMKGLDYTLIDMASYREDGCLFFDTAYFELSLLLHGRKRESSEEWLRCIGNMAERRWDAVKSADTEALEEIVKQEYDWIERMTARSLEAGQELKEARILGRILAGLDYAGKRGVGEAVRMKAYLYSCYYLGRMITW